MNQKTKKIYVPLTSLPLSKFVELTCRANTFLNAYLVIRKYCPISTKQLKPIWESLNN